MHLEANKENEQVNNVKQSEDNKKPQTVLKNDRTCQNTKRTLFDKTVVALWNIPQELTALQLAFAGLQFGEVVNFIFLEQQGRVNDKKKE